MLKSLDLGNIITGIVAIAAGIFLLRNYNRFAEDIYARCAVGFEKPPRLSRKTFSIFFLCLSVLATVLGIVTIFLLPFLHDDYGGQVLHTSDDRVFTFYGLMGGFIGLFIINATLFLTIMICVIVYMHEPGIFHL